MKKYRVDYQDHGNSEWYAAGMNEFDVVAGNEREAVNLARQKFADKLGTDTNYRAVEVKEGK